MRHHKKSNSSKSKNGYALNKDVKTIFLNKLKNNEIKSYKCEPKYHFPGFENMQFKPDGEIVLNNNTVLIIDNTTSARHDRFKQKQWDAYGVKQYFKEYHPDADVKYYIVLPDKDNLGSISTREKEFNNFLREKNKINSPNYYSEVDDILHVSELLNIAK